MLEKHTFIIRINRIVFYILYINNRYPHNKYSGSGSASELYQDILQLVKHEQNRSVHFQICLIGAERFCLRIFVNYNLRISTDFLSFDTKISSSLIQ